MCEWETEWERRSSLSNQTGVWIIYSSGGPVTTWRIFQHQRKKSNSSLQLYHFSPSQVSFCHLLDPSLNNTEVGNCARSSLSFYVIATKYQVWTAYFCSKKSCCNCALLLLSGLLGDGGRGRDRRGKSPDAPPDWRTVSQSRVNGWRTALHQTRGKK